MWHDYKMQIRIAPGVRYAFCQGEKFLGDDGYHRYAPLFQFGAGDDNCRRAAASGAKTNDRGVHLIGEFVRCARRQAAPSRKTGYLPDGLEYPLLIEELSYATYKHVIAAPIVTPQPDNFSTKTVDTGR